MNKIRTAELTGAALDWAVAKCEGYSKDTAHFAEFAVRQRMYGVHLWSSSWQLAGPIIEHKGINLNKEGAIWWAHRAQAPHHNHEAATPLIAAMRCYVASKLGDEVETPKELNEE